MMPRGRYSPRSTTFILLLLLPFLALASLLTGAISLSLADLWQTDSVAQQVLLELRLPRLLTTLLSGALLGMTGAAIQAMFRNPLADPSLIGVSAGAGLAAVAVIVLGGSVISRWEPLLLPLAAFAGGLGSTWLVARLARSLNGVSVTTMLLVGIAINAIAAAGISLLKYLADALTLQQVVFWLLGGLQDHGWQAVISLLLVAVPVGAGLLREGERLNLLLLGEQQARLLGLAVEQCQRRLIVFSALGVGVVVALGGMIGFVGLVVPHLVRLLCGPDNRSLLPLSALLGALFLTLADLCSRILLAPSELPIGVVTALIGGPFFLAMIVYRRRGGD